jgi:hypothetical protein
VKACKRASRATMLRKNKTAILGCIRRARHITEVVGGLPGNHIQLLDRVGPKYLNQVGQDWGMDLHRLEGRCLVYIAGSTRRTCKSGGITGASG